METIPTKIGKYSIECLIAQGGMGAVYKGIHPTLNRYVILKKLTIGGNSQFIQRFNREARIMMDFKNDNIVDVYDHFKEDGNYYIVLEYVDGISLEKFLMSQRYLTNELALYIIYQVSLALKYAHNKNVIHRDIKPANILLSNSGEVKLVDFGIAVSDIDSDDDLTKEGITLGTPSYMAPEQFKNSKNVDKRADIYSLGVILYELITGKKPFPSGFTPEVISLINKGRYKNPKKINPGVNSKVLMLIKKMMKPKPKRRVRDLDFVITTLKKTFRPETDKVYIEQITDLMLGNPIKEQITKKKRYAIPAITLFILFISLFVKLNELPIKYRLGKNLGVADFSLNINDSYYKKPNEIFINTRLYLETGNKLNFLEEQQIRFRHIKSDDSRFTFISDKNYLPTGNYRMKVVVDGNLFWNNFIIFSKDELNIKLQYKLSEPQSLNTYLNVYDFESGKNITQSSNIYIKKSNKYIIYNKDDENLKTDAVYFFKCEKEGFETKEFILRIESDQTDLTLNINMYPLEKGENSVNKI